MQDNKDQPNAIARVDAQERDVLNADAAASLQPASPVQDERLPSAHWLGTNSSTLTAIERLRATIDEETEKLEVRAAVDFDAFSQRKNRGLLELTRAMRLMKNDAADPRITPELTSLRASLIRNQAALQIHLDAVREVSGIIARSIQEVESDGTYSLIAARKSK